MGIESCLRKVVKEGRLSKEEMADVMEAYEAYLTKAKLHEGDGAGAIAAARKELEENLRAQALEMRRRAALTKAKKLEIDNFLLNYRDVSGEGHIGQATESLLSHYGYRGRSSVRGRREAILSLAHGKLADLMLEYQRHHLTGLRMGRDSLPDLVRALKGEKVPSEQAQIFAKAVGEVMEDLRQRFNKAGGAIAKLEGWGLPQTHAASKIRKAGRAAWKEMIAPLLDADKMVDGLTKKPLGRAGLAAALDHVYDNIVSHGLAHKKPTMQVAGKGSLASQRQDHRFLVFKDADSWLAYNEAFGEGDVIQGIFNHINSMAKDIAFMEILGPNPEAMLTYLKNVVRHEYALMAAGKDSLAKEKTLFKSVERKVKNLDSIYQQLRGLPEVDAPVARVASDARNLMTASMLGSTGILSILTDGFTAVAGRKLAGLKVTHDMGASFCP